MFDLSLLAWVMLLIDWCVSMVACSCSTAAELYSFCQATTRFFLIRCAWSIACYIYAIVCLRQYCVCYPYQGVILIMFRASSLLMSSWNILTRQWKCVLFDESAICIQYRTQLFLSSICSGFSPLCVGFVWILVVHNFDSLQNI
jgi:hypothetical protein